MEIKEIIDTAVFQSNGSTKVDFGHYMKTVSIQLGNLHEEMLKLRKI